MASLNVSFVSKVNAPLSYDGRENWNSDADISGGEFNLYAQLYEQTRHSESARPKFRMGREAILATDGFLLHIAMKYQIRHWESSLLQVGMTWRGLSDD